MKLNKILVTSTVHLCGFQYVDTDSPPHTLVPSTVEGAIPPQALVLQILSTKQIIAPAPEWGKAHEEVALQQYEHHQHSAGHSHLFCCSGFIVSDEHPFLGASVVYNPDNDDSFGLAEVKCLYSVRFITPAEACSHKDFCSILETSTSTGQHQLKLKENHKYYSKLKAKWLSASINGVISYLLPRG